MNADSPLIQLEVSESNTRLDTWLANELPDLSRARIQKLISQSCVKVNDDICTSKNIKLKPSDRIEITIPDSTPLELQPQSIPLDVLYEDEHLIIINKQAGLVVHPAAGHADGTLVNALLAHCHNLAGIGGVQRPGIVHRLDKDTTGAMVVAKTDLAFQHLQNQLKDKTARREYLGVVYGSPREDSGRIDEPIGRHLGDRIKMAVIPESKGGRPSVTHWRVEERFGNYTLMHFQLETGRTHQIRVHIAHLGHPIVGDPIYSSGRSVGVNLSGQALHAWRLTLEHPLSGETIEAIAPIPSELAKLIDIFRRRHHS
ncbi:RluA family pseudouridine synthase [Merismopedia glauca]|uniref:Pseudouridine synthase n=1 Tax=Merismopedia glauca CCAP 1448/3 TaxID=1296344 RepID=A0A2T1C424_9CYAN|nr:RluA family pseudouridine synthase [Merismopedia glauca]PSB02897.1 RluA family pseudouridine synthase [Merismopedia glauca CCAP 1448/3]